MTGSVPFPHPNPERVDPGTMRQLAALAQMPASDEGEPLIEEDDEGGAYVSFETDALDVAQLPFDANLAEAMDIAERQVLASELLDLIESDIEARKKRDDQYKEALERSGLAGDDNAVGGADFPGASKVDHPVLTESCVDFEAMMIKELYPPNGPVRSSIVGTPTPEKLAKADRKTKFLNWQLTQQCKEYPGELEQLLTQLPMGGTQYLKVWWDAEKGRPAFEFFPVDDTFLPPSASQWYTSRRKTLRMYLDEMEFQSRINTGMYIDVDVAPPESPQRSGVAEVNDKIEGKSLDSGNKDGVRVVYECYVQMVIDGVDERPAPYIVTIDDASRDVVGLYRNWDEADQRREELPWVVEFQFIPWRGALGIGLWHLIGGLARAATGSLRALLDSALVNTSPTGIKLKGARISGQNQNPQPGQTAEIEGPAGDATPDVRRYFMAMPFNPPSPVLFELLGWLTTQAKGVVTTAEEKIADATNSMAVGTAQALIEQGSRVFSAIHARQHRSQREVLNILHRLNARYLDDQVVVAELGEMMVTRADFQGPMDVIPVSDPAIFSETQRYAQAQAIKQLADADAQMAAATQRPPRYDMYAVDRRVLETLKVPDIDKLLPPPPKPQPLDPVTAVVSMMQGQNVQAFPDQDHMAHIQVVAQAMLDPNLGSNPMLAPTFIPRAAQYIGQHVVMMYALMMAQAAGVPPEMSGQPMDPQTATQVAQALARAREVVHPQLAMQLAGLSELLTHGMNALRMANEAMQTLIPPPPPDPSIEVARQEVERQSRRDENEAALKAEKQQQEAESDATDHALREREQDLRVDMNDADNTAAMMLAMLKQGAPRVSKNPDFNLNPGSR